MGQLLDKPPAAELDFDIDASETWPDFRPTVDQARPPTADEMYLVMTEPGVEFSDGELLEHHMSKSGAKSCGRIIGLLFNAAEDEPVDVLTQDMPYHTWPGTFRFRKPDVTVVSHERQAANGIGPDDDPGHFEIVPDLAVEVLSKHDRPGRLEQKLREYEEAQFPLTWIIDPKKQLVIVLPLGEPRTTLSGDQMLTLPGLLPNFRTQIAKLFS